MKVEEEVEAMASGDKLRRHESEAWERRLSLRGEDSCAWSVEAINASAFSVRNCL